LIVFVSCGGFRAVGGSCFRADELVEGVVGVVNDGGLAVFGAGFPDAVAGIVILVRNFVGCVGRGFARTSTCTRTAIAGLRPGCGRIPV